MNGLFSGLTCLEKFSTCKFRQCNVVSLVYIRTLDDHGKGLPVIKGPNWLRDNIFLLRVDKVLYSGFKAVQLLLSSWPLELD